MKASDPAQLCCTEDVKEYLDKVKKSSSSRYVKYAAWQKEAEAAVPFLKNIHSERKVSGILPFQELELACGAISALTRIVTEIKKKEPVDFTKLTISSNLAKIGIEVTGDNIDITKFNSKTEWGHPSDGTKPIKDLGWSGANAQQFAKDFATAIKNIGSETDYNNWISQTVSAYSTQTAGTETYTKLAKVVKQAQHVSKIRHAIIVDVYQQFVSIKKTL